MMDLVTKAFTKDKIRTKLGLFKLGPETKFSAAS